MKYLVNPVSLSLKDCRTHLPIESIMPPPKGQLDGSAATAQSKSEVPARDHCFFLDVSEFLIAAAAAEKEKSGPRPGKGIATLHLEFDRPARTRMSDCTLILHLKAPLYLTLMSPTKVLGSSHTYMNLPSCQLFASSLLTFQPGQRKSSQR